MIDEAELMYAEENNMGYCTSCEEFTRECTEPDAENYSCPVCEKHTVQGVLNYLIENM